MNTDNNKVVLITGGLGTTGTALTKYILKHEPMTKILIIDNLYKAGSSENLLEIIEHASDRVIVNIIDIRDNTIYKLLDEYPNINEVYNLAAVVETPTFYKNPDLTYEVNCEAAIKLLKYFIATERPIKFINCSSSEIYGHITDDSSYPIKENHPCTYESPEVSTRWSYAHGKILNEYVMNKLVENTNVRVCHLRYANVYGENDINPVHIIPYVATQLINNDKLTVSKDFNHIRRSFLHNDDSTLGTYLAMKGLDNPEVNGLAFNIGNPEEVTLVELVNRIKHEISQITNHTPEVIYDCSIDRPGDPHRRLLDTTRAHELLGFSCHVSLDEGLRRVITKILSTRN